MPQQLLLKSITPACLGTHRGALSFSEGNSVLLGDSMYSCKYCVQLATLCNYPLYNTRSILLLKCFTVYCVLNWNLSWLVVSSMCVGESVVSKQEDEMETSERRTAGSCSTRERTGEREERNPVALWVCWHGGTASPCRLPSQWGRQSRQWPELWTRPLMTFWKLPPEPYSFPQESTFLGFLGPAISICYESATSSSWRDWTQTKKQAQYRQGKRIQTKDWENGWR